MEEKLIDILNKILRKKEKPELTKIDKSLNLKDDLGFDSLDLAELTVRIEDQFGIDIFEDGIITLVDEIICKIK